MKMAFTSILAVLVLAATAWAADLVPSVGMSEGAIDDSFAKVLLQESATDTKYVIMANNAERIMFFTPDGEQHFGWVRWWIWIDKKTHLITKIARIPMGANAAG